MRSFYSLLVVFLVFSSTIMIAEEHLEHSESAQHDMSAKHRLAVYTGFTHIPNAFYEHETHEQSSGKWVPTIGVDYFRKLNKRWELGCMIDMEFDNYIVKLKDESEVERLNVLVAAIVAKYSFYKRCSILAGPGYEGEFSTSNKNFIVAKVGIEYEAHIGNGWDFSPSIIFDFKQEYSTYAYGFAIGKRF